ncbi:transporter substrate-binding domain-containing protein [Psychromonas sp.]|uniref:transporter substrate-binding domain-containing protein n=1 Tax=Psychromonas sp. TaxID=1884585 RepID=UPI003562C9BB
MNRIFVNFKISIVVFTLFLLHMATFTVSAAEKQSTLQADKQKAPAAVSSSLPSEMLALLSEEERNWLAVHPRISIGAHHARPPISYVDRRGVPQGIEVRLIEALNKRLGERLKIVPGPWQQSYDRVRSRELDAMMDIKPMVEREPYFNFTEPYLDVPYAIFARDDSPYLKDLNDLSTKKVAIRRGHSLLPVLQKHYANIEVIEYGTRSDGLNAVGRGEVDAYIGNRTLVNYIIEHELISNVVQYGTVSELSSINAIAVRKDWPILRDILQKAMDTISVQERRTIFQYWLDPRQQNASLKLNAREQAWKNAHPVVTVATPNHWPPLLSRRRGMHLGATVDYLDLLHGLTGIEFKLDSRSSKTVMARAQQHKIDILAGVAFTDQLADKFIFKTPYFSSPVAAVTKAWTKYDTINTDRVEFWHPDMADVSGVAVDKGSDIHNLLSQEYPQLKLKLVADLSQALPLLSDGLVNTYLGTHSDISGYDISEEYLPLKDTRLPEVPLYFAVRADWPELASIISKALAVISDQQQLKIYHRWRTMGSAQSRQVEQAVMLSPAEQKWLQAHPGLKLGAEPNWPPLGYFNQQGEYSGLLADYHALIERSLGISMEEHSAPSWAEVMAKLNLGELDVIAGINPTVERRKKFLFTNTYIDQPLVAFTHLDMPDLQSMQALRGKIVALPNGHQQEERVRRDYPQIEILEVATVADGLKAVSSGRADAYLGNPFAAGNAINENDLQDLRINFTTEYPYQLAYAVRKDMPELVPILNKALASISEQSRYRIENQWLQEELDRARVLKSDKQFDYKNVIAWFSILLLALLLLLVFINRLQRKLWERIFARQNLIYMMTSVVAVFLSIALLVTWLALQREELHFREELGKNLENVNNAVKQSLMLWQDKGFYDAQRFAADPQVFSSVETLLALPRDSETLISSDALASLRAIYDDYNREIGAQGFFVIAPDGTSLASWRDINMGSQNLIATQKPELFARVLAGESVLVPPIFSDIVQKDATGRLLTEAPTMFFAEPLRDQSGQVIAVFTLRFDPAEEFSEIIQAGRIGDSGDSYAFDRQGRLLTRARFAENLATVSEYYQQGDKLLSFAIKDPGGNLLQGYRPEQSSAADWPLTLMAKSALAGGRGINTEGYRDYRGVPVMGAWVWSSRLGIGVATEIDIAEALAPYKSMRIVVLVALGSVCLIALLLTTIAIWFSERARSRLSGLVIERTEKLHRIARELRQSEERLALSTSGSGDGLWDINTKDGTVWFSDRFRALLGYRDEQDYPNKLDSWLDGLHPDDKARVFAASEAHMEQGIPYDIEYRLRTKQGEWRWFNARAKLLRDASGEKVRMAGSMTDIHERKIMAEMLANERAQLQSIIDSSPVGISIVIDGVIEVANPRFVELYGLQQGEGVFQAYFDPNERNKLLTCLKEEGIVKNREIFAYGAKQQVLTILLTLKQIDYHGQLAVLSWSTDITEQKVIQNELSQARDKADESTKAKSEFLANMSHEIRTPMNAIIGLSYLALQTDLDSKQRNYIEKVNYSAESLLGIINDILDFSKIEAGQLAIEKNDFHLEDVFNNLANLLGLKAEEKKLELMFDLSPQLPFTLIGDPLRLTQILLNLGNNAVKFTEQGNIIIKAEVREENEQQVKLYFSIRDTGVGLSAEQQQRLFKAFSQADTSTTRKYGGTGLGLVISKNLVELMGGEIWLDSEAGVGSNFQFTVTLQKQHGKSSMIGLPARKLQGLRVLVVDDNEAAREILCTMLSSFELRTDCVASGQAALLKLEQAIDDPYQLVLMDWQMPGMNGVETARAIHNSSRLSNLPTVIMVTAYGREEASRAAENVQISKFITKPVTPSLLLDALLVAAENEGKVEVSKQQWGEVDTAIAALQGAKVLLVEDNEINQELAVALLSDNGLFVEVANNGQEALDMLAQEEFDGVLMDCQMPVLDGYQATRQLRQQARFKDLPVLAMTANAMVGDREKVLEAGMNDHIAKPINVNEMFITIARWVTPSAPVSARQAEQLANLNKAEIPELDGINREEGLARTMHNKELYLKLLRRVKDKLPGFIEAFDAAFAGQDWQQANMLSHTYKGLAGLIAAGGLQEACQVLEAQTQQQQAGAHEREVLRREVQRIQRSLAKLPENSEQRAETAVDPARINELLDRLAQQLTDFDVTAVDTLNQDYELLSTGQLAPLAKSLQSALADYDFTGGLKLLDEMRNSCSKHKS